MVRYKRKRTFRKKGTKKQRTNRKVARIGTVKRLISKNEETKWKTQNESLESGYAAGFPGLYLLNGITQGTQRYGRIGNRVTLKTLNLTMSIVANTTTRGVNRLRFLLFWDKQCNGQMPELQTIFADVPAAYDTGTILSTLNPDYWGSRYILIKDRTYMVGQEGGAVDYSQEKQIRFRIPLKNKIVYYNDGTGNTISAINKNSLIMIAVADEAQANQPGVTVRSLITWKDA